MATKIIVKDAEIRRMMSRDGGIGRAANRMAGRIRDRAKVFSPVSTGLLRNSIHSRQVSPDGALTITYTIGSDVHYAIYQELGTGPIFPRYAPYLVFKINGKFVRVKSTSGVPAMHYLERALDDVVKLGFPG